MQLEITEKAAVLLKKKGGVLAIDFIKPVG